MHDALMLLPPDFDAPPRHISMRFPPLGPAVVAASTAALGLRFRAVDLVVECERRPLLHDSAPLQDTGRVAAHLGTAPDLAIEAAIDELIERVEQAGGRAQLVAISVDRGSQTPLVAALAVELKRRWGARLIVGGVSMRNLHALLERTGALGPDVVTTASTPAQIARAFDVLIELPENRLGPPIEPNEDLVQLVRSGMRAAPAADGWPMPDFSLYDLRQYRRDLLQADRGREHAGPTLEPSVVLPYFFSFECQYSCAFCQTGGTQSAKTPDQVVRELALLSERWGVGEFMFFDTQINLLAEPLSRALVDARLDLRWSDSLRVRPLSPGLLELMARAGCSSITVGVESASPRVLKAMVKGHLPEHASAMVREAHACEMLLRVNILTCFPGETEDELAETCAWVREHAFAIDDLAPSSFYLTADSPIGRRPERFGIVLRGARSLSGRNRFRKSPDSLAYDEVDGYSWEERAQMLDASEAQVRAAWNEGRAGNRFSGALSPSTMLAMRRRFATKREIHEYLSPQKPEARVEMEQRAEPLTAHLVSPRRPAPALERVFALAFEEALPSIASRLVPDATAHALLFPDGSFCFFRGSIVRDSREQARAITVDERLGAVVGPAARDARAAALNSGARLGAGAIRSTLGRVLVLSFKVSTRAESEPA